MNNQTSGNQTRRSPSSGSTIRLLAAAPDLADFLTPEEREEAERIALPVVRLEGPLDIAELLESANAFAALVIDGMLLRQLRIGEQPTLRIFGPGELVATGATPTSMLVVQSESRAVDPTHVAMIGIEFLAGAHRWPRLIAGLQSRMADGQERLAMQLAICQLPRVQDRILAMLWLLAESWGRVTSAGTSLSLSLTHEALGALVGARRPTVTLALRELTERGALVHQDRSWLLLEPPPSPTAGDAQIDAPEIITLSESPWTAQELPTQEPDTELHEMLQQTLVRLREDHRRNSENHRTIIRQMIATRENNAEIRRRIREQVVNYPPPAPSAVSALFVDRFHHHDDA
jgi:CRP/FNR family transcriptional regulator, cyclic AMP receptor protein